ncbi:hypothetical protein FPV67DRAFT_1701843 [Lyophyllum atratum]|nr:hypothetical protein FPV67DRAFT_1701843 [Lyophyllum atratum]
MSSTHPPPPRPLLATSLFSAASGLSAPPSRFSRASSAIDAPRSITELVAPALSISECMQEFLNDKQYADLACLQKNPVLFVVFLGPVTLLLPVQPPPPPPTHPNRVRRDPRRHLTNASRIKPGDVEPRGPPWWRREGVPKPGADPANPNPDLTNPDPLNTDPSNPEPEDAAAGGDLKPGPFCPALSKRDGPSKPDPSNPDAPTDPSKPEDTDAGGDPKSDPSNPDPSKPDNRSKPDDLSKPDPPIPDPKPEDSKPEEPGAGGDPKLTLRSLILAVQNLFQQTAPSSAYLTPPPPGITNSSYSLAFALGRPPLPKFKRDAIDWLAENGDDEHLKIVDPNHRKAISINADGLPRNFNFFPPHLGATMEDAEDGTDGTAFEGEIPDYRRQPDINLALSPRTSWHHVLQH